MRDETERTAKTTSISARPSALVEILRSHWQNTKRTRPCYTLRAFSKRLGVSPSSIYEIVNGTRHMGVPTAKRICQVLEVPPAQASLLVTEVKNILLNCRKKSGRSATAGKTRNLARRRFQSLTNSELHFIRDWYHVAILSLAEIPGFSDQPAWIARRLGIKTNEATSALRVLGELGLLAQDSRGRLRATGKQFSSTNDIPSHALREHHRQGIQQTLEALENVPVELREIASTVIATDPRSVTEIKKFLRKMRRQAAARLESGEKLEVYRLSLALIPLTQPEKNT